MTHHLYGQAAVLACFRAGLGITALEKGIVAWLVEQARWRHSRIELGVDFCECGVAGTSRHAPDCWFTLLATAEAVRE